MEYPDIFFFPLTEPEPVRLLGMSHGVLARRIPDFLCLCLNERGQDRVGLLEMRAADEQGVPTGEWASFDHLPAADEIMSFLPENGVEAAIIGTLEGTQEGMDVRLTVVRESTGIANRSLDWKLNLRDPARSCVDLARRLAGELALPLSGLTWRKHGTKSPEAFLHFLNGLDGAAQLDPQASSSEDPRKLLAPFLDALAADPDFGLALRRLHATLTGAIAALQMPVEDAFEIYDKALETRPGDKEALASIAEFLAALGDSERAEDWLRLAVEREDPPPLALETLGILLANRGETVEARDLWLTGARIDGHPDFFAHLARLAFTEQSPDEAWDKVLRGLRRISERGLHPGEWEEDEGRGGVLLRYLTEHLEESERPPPADAVELLGDLSGQIVEPEDRLDLGLCLAHVNRPEQAKGELRAALPHVEDHDRRDIGARKLCELMFPGFDERITRMAETEDTGEQPDALLAFLASVTEEVPQYWPAWFYRGRILERQGRWNEAYDAFRQAVTLRRDQAEIHARMAVSAYVLGRHVDALDAMQRAIEILPQDAGLHADHALLLFRAGKVEDAWKELEVAEVFDLDHEAVRMTRKILEAG